jgi:hypothetical protein
MGGRRGRIGPAGAGFALVLLLTAAAVAAAPVALVSLGRYLYGRTLGAAVYRLTPAGAVPAPAHTRLHVEVVRLDELARQVTLRVSGNHVCEGCGHQARVVFVALPPQDGPREGLPPAAAVTLPAASDRVTADLQLPVRGDLIAYPFDRYTLRLGLALERLPPAPAGAPGDAGPVAPVAVPPEEAVAHVFVTLEELAPQLDVAALRPLEAGGMRAEPPAPTGPGPPAYLSVTDLALDRPVYLRVQVVLVVALVAAGAAYAVALRPFADQFANAGGLLVGVWGIRSLLLGTLPPYATAVDGVLTAVLLLLLEAVAVRALYHLHDRAGLRVLPRPRRGRRGGGVPVPPGPPGRAHAP